MEFALIVPLILLLVMAIAEVTVVARTALQLTAAGREGARVAATSPDPARAIQATRRALGPALADRARITVRRPPVVGRPARVTVAVDHVLLAALGGLRIPLESTAEMRVEA